MDSNTKACIINAHNGTKWYPRGQRRLVNSLVHHGVQWDILTWGDWPNDEFNKSCPYNIKAAAFTEAIRLGYTHILWLDCSVWALKYPEKIFDLINEHGYYFWGSGFNCAQTCSDACLNYFETDRDTAEGYEDCSTSMFGVNLENPTGKEFIERWIQAAKDGVFHGSREHDNQSQDPRFQFHRQDQSAASMLIGKMGLYIHPPGEYSSYYPVKNDSVIFAMQGL